MKQKFEKLEDGKIKWSWEKENKEFEDKDFGVVGSEGSQGHIFFENHEKALAVLNRDIEDATKLADSHKSVMDKNSYDEEKFKLIKPLIDGIGKLHNDFKEVKLMPETINGANMGKYIKFLKDFNTAKAYITNELSNFNKEYGKFLAYGPAKKAHGFVIEQLDKIVKQKEELMKLKD